jgi:hypothetical protein
MAEYLNLRHLSPQLAFSKLVPQLFNLTELLDDFELCTYDQEGNFRYPESLALCRSSIVSDDPSSLYLLVFRSMFLFLMPNQKPDPHILTSLLGDNFKERVAAGDLDDLYPLSRRLSSSALVPYTLTARLLQFVALEELNTLGSVRTRLALRNTQQEAIFFSVLDEFANIQIS